MRKGKERRGQRKKEEEMNYKERRGELWRNYEMSNEERQGDKMKQENEWKREI